MCAPLYTLRDLCALGGNRQNRAKGTIKQGNGRVARSALKLDRGRYAPRTNSLLAWLPCEMGREEKSGYRPVPHARYRSAIAPRCPPATPGIKGMSTMPQAPPRMLPWHRKALMLYAAGTPVKDIAVELRRTPGGVWTVIRRNRPYLIELMDYQDKTFMEALTTAHTITAMATLSNRNPKHSKGLGPVKQRKSKADQQPPAPLPDSGAAPSLDAPPAPSPAPSPAPEVPQVEGYIVGIPVDGIPEDS